MDKNKNQNRTDLLAAGRKKLQQFRQKKDKGSGSHGKSTKKSGKSDQHEVDATAVSTSTNPKAVTQVGKGETESAVGSDTEIVNTSESNSVENSADSDTSGAVVRPSAVPISQEKHVVKTELEKYAESLSEDVQDSKPDVDSSIQIDGETAGIADTEVARDISSDTSHSVDFEAENSKLSMPADVSAQHDSVDTAEQMSVSVELESLNREKALLPSPEKINTSLTQERDDQVTDEADGLDARQSNDYLEAKVEHEGDIRPSLSEIETTVEPDPDSYVDAQSGEVDEVSVSADATMSNVPSVFASDAKPSFPSGEVEVVLEGDNNVLLTELDRRDEMVSSLLSSVHNQSGEIEEVSVRDGGTKFDGHSVSPIKLSEADDSSVVSAAVTDSFNEEKLEPQSGFGFVQGREERVVADSDYNAVGVDLHQEPAIGIERPLEISVMNSDRGSASPIAESRSISLSQLRELITRLNKEEFCTLLKSIQSVSGTLLGSTSLIIAERGFQEIFEQLKEELVLTNFTKDIFHLQIEQQSEMQSESDCKHHQLLDETSLLCVSLSEASEKNQCLADELAQCRSELRTVAYEKEEFRNQFHTARAEIEEPSSRANKLHKNLESGHQDLLRLSTELADCRTLVQALQVENEEKCGTIASMGEDRIKFIEENNIHLVEKEKLSADLTDCRNFVATLQCQISTLNENLDSATGERKRLEDERDHLSSEYEKREMELVDSKNVVSALQVENSCLNESLSMIMEQKKRLEEEKEYSAHEIEKLSVELDLLRKQLSVEHEERVRVEVDLKETAKRLEQLNDEKISLTSSLEILKAKMSKVERIGFKIPAVAGEAGNQIELSRGHELGIEDDNTQKVPEKLGSEASIVLDKPLSDGFLECSPFENFRQEVFDDSDGFKTFNGHLDKADEMLQKLVQEVESICAHSASLSKSGDKVTVPQVSKLIQAFESKSHLDEHVDQGLTDNQLPADPVLSVRGQVGNLRSLFRQLLVEASNASLLLKEERDGKKNADATSEELKSHNEALEEYSKKLEGTNIELGVLYEALEQHRVSVESRNCELSIICESLQLQITNLEAEHAEVDRKLHVYESGTSRLQSGLHDLQSSSNTLVSQISEQLQNFHKEAAEKVLILEGYWNSTIDPVFEATGKLVESLGSATTTTLVSHGYLDRIIHSIASVNDAICFIEDLKEKLESSQKEHEAVCTLYKEANEKYDDLHEKSNLTSDMLHNLYRNLTKLLTVLHGCTDENGMFLESEMLPDLLDYSNYETIIDRLDSYLRGSLQLKSVNRKLNSELMAKAEEVEALKQRCLDSTAVQKLIEDVGGVLKMEYLEFEVDKTPASRLESLVSCLVRKCQKFDVQVGLSNEEFGSKMKKLTLLQEEVQQLNAMCLQHESELIVLRESLHQAEDALLVARSELQGKVNELEQSELRVSSLREKLTIAVTKGKGLIVQRDGLKQSLSDKSIELERFSRELQLKDARLLEVEAKLKAHSESGERVEALESELSYIRNSATALRESFLLKDSVLQRIEEILEDLDLPEHFHSRDIIEKIDWLARTTTSNASPARDSDHKSSADEASYSAAGFVVMDSCKDDAPPSSGLDEDFRRKYDELQSSFYGLAEQNEMLEQSLLERNNIVQRWEAVLDRIDMPSHLRSVEPEDRIEWLRKALSEVQEDNMSLQQNVVSLENRCVSLSDDLEDSQRRVSDLEADLQSFIHERENLSERLDTLVIDHEKISVKAAEFETENEKLQKEVLDLQENVAKMHGFENQIFSIEADLRRLQSLVTDALEVSGLKYEYSSGSSIECLGVILNKLLESYAILSSAKPVHEGGAEVVYTENSDATVVVSRSLNTPDPQGSDTAVLKKELEEVQYELSDVRVERDGYKEKHQSLVSELEAQHKIVNELQGLLNQEELKTASVREKLNVAVRKGKSLVQQRDSLKQNIDDISSEVERLRSEIKIGEVKIQEYEQNIKDLSTYPGRVEALESDTLFLRNCLNETEQNLQHKAYTLNMVVNILQNIDVGDDFNSDDPVVKLEQIGKLCFDLRTDLASSEQEAKKSKRAAELLLAELNEVQERNDFLQEELANLADKLSILSEEKDLAVAGKLEAVSSLEKLSFAISKEREHQFSELAGLKSDVDLLRKDFHDIRNSLAGLFHNNLEFLDNLESGINSCLRSNGGNVADVHPFIAAAGLMNRKSDKENFVSTNSWADPNAHEHREDKFGIESLTYVTRYVQELMMEIGVVKEKLSEHSESLHEKSSSVCRLMDIVRGEITSNNESFEALKKDFLQMEMVKKEKDKELLVLHRNAALLLEACTSSLVEITRRKAEVVRNSWAVGDMGMTSDTAESSMEGLSFSGEGQLYSEDSVRSVADRLLSAARDFASITAKLVEGSQKEMKLTILNLQKELQEKDVQKERIFMELASQIKEGEATTSSYLVDLESSKTLVHNLEKQLEVMKGERHLLEQRVKELEDGQATSAELQERVRSLTDVIAAKDHEIEELMQALDEEEIQMQGITYKIKELEKIVEQRNLDLGNLEASRGKVMKKLSSTVNKFDELHHLSASLLAEVEKLQSQLQDRDSEISFLRQEVTRCTNDVLVASQVSNKGNSDEIHELLTWFKMNIAGFGVHNEYFEDENNGDIPEQKEVLKKAVGSILSELGNLRAAAQSKDMLLQDQRTKLEELKRKGETLEKSLREKDSRLNLLEGVEHSGQATSKTSEIHEVEPAVNKWAASGSSIASQVRSLRKGNSEQVAIAIDMDPVSTGRLEDEEDDKVHGFKSLTTSRIIPRFTRPVTDMVDGLWVSCDRTLMRKPILRLGIIFYWFFLHTLLATLAI